LLQQVTAELLGGGRCFVVECPGSAVRIEEHRLPELVCAEMVANVFAVAVAEGDSVEPGAMLLVLESMKMEIPVLSEGGGTVTEVKVQKGDVVQEGDVLVVVS
ncbi:MAG TPA: biotin/lipoyl-binding carrier protein, partial [Jiangellaceae bacterium]